MWIDLTYTSRFYNKVDVENEGCRYYKLQCRGHGETPSEEQTNIFINMVHQFIANHPLEAIAVHCTHGFNRTGFLIVSYLVERMDCAIEIALEMFAKVRHPGIYKQDYLRELYRRYGDVEDTPPAPPLPNWCDEEDEDSENMDGPEASSSQNTVKKFRNKPAPSFMAGVPGVSALLEQPKAFNLQKKIQAMCEWKR